MHVCNLNADKKKWRNTSSWTNHVLLPGAWSEAPASPEAQGYAEKGGFPKKTEQNKTNNGGFVRKEKGEMTLRHVINSVCNIRLGEG